MENARNRENESYNNNQYQYDPWQQRFISRDYDQDHMSQGRINAGGFEENQLCYKDAKK